MSGACVFCHRQDALINNTNFLLQCSQCDTFYHHRCHRPPVPDKDVVHIIQFLRQAKGRDLKAPWKCSSCVSGKGVRSPSITTATAPANILQPRKEIIVLDDDGDVIEEVNLPPSRASSRTIIKNDDRSARLPQQSQPSEKLARPFNAATKSTSYTNKDSNDPDARANNVAKKLTGIKTTTTKKTTAVKTTVPVPSQANPTSLNVVSHNSRTGITIVDDPLDFPAAPGPHSGSNASTSSNSGTATLLHRTSAVASPPPLPSLPQSRRSHSIVSKFVDLNMSTDVEMETAEDNNTVVREMKPRVDKGKGKMKEKDELPVTKAISQPKLLTDWIHVKRSRVIVAFDNAGPAIQPDLWDRRAAMNKLPAKRRPRKFQARPLHPGLSSQQIANIPITTFISQHWMKEKQQHLDIH